MSWSIKVSVKLPVKTRTPITAGMATAAKR